VRKGWKAELDLSPPLEDPTTAERRVRRVRSLGALVALFALVEALVPASDVHAQEELLAEERAAAFRLELELAEDRVKEQTLDRPLSIDSAACVTNTISYDRNSNAATSRNGTIDNSDCVSNDGLTRFDVWEFSGTSGDRLRIDLEQTSGNLDPFLLLIDPLTNLYDEDDDSGSGLDARIVTTLNRTGNWSLTASGLPGFSETGGYRLSVRCENCSPAPSQCFKSSTTLCLNNDRFQVRVNWRNFEGQTGVGSAVPGASATSANLWFFQPDNWELLIKVLDACGLNNRYWVFFAATTNVEFAVTVTDTQTGAVRNYSNPLGQSADAITDTNAFATCP
jgi:hypothetical protein